MADLGWLTERPIAHRGLHDVRRGIVENSAGAVAAALEHGYAIEIDLQVTADDQAVVFHDETLDRLTTATGPVAERTLADLTAIGYRDGADTILSLDGLLQQVDGATPLVIELKTLWDGRDRLERCVADALGSYRGPAAVMSFDPHAIATLRRLAPGLVRGIVACRFTHAGEWPMLTAWQRFYLRHMLHWQRTKPDFISYDQDGLSAPVPRLARAMGWPVITWTIRNEAERVTAARWADQITFEGFLPTVQAGGANGTHGVSA